MRPFFLATAAVFISITSLTALADPCDDYAGRHYKTDVAPTAAVAFRGSRSGDIVSGPSLQVTVTNVGAYAITDPAGPGDLVHARRVGINVKGTILYGYLPMPLYPGQSAKVSVNTPAGLIGTCELLTVTLVAHDTIPQDGCQVAANDSLTFRALFDSRFCIIDRPVWGRNGDMEYFGSDDEIETTEPSDLGTKLD